VFALQQPSRLTETRPAVNIPLAMATGQESVAQRVRRLRKERGLSLRDLSAPGISYAYISRIEAGTRIPSANALRLLARRLGVSLHYLETGSRVPGHVLRERRLADAELELRLERDVQRAETIFTAEIDGDSGFVYDPVLAARAHAGLGLLAARRAHPREAVRHLEDATQTGYYDPVVRPDVYEELATAYAASGEPRKAVELAERCLAEVEARAPANVAVAVRFYTRIALAASALGELRQVREALASAIERAKRERLPHLQSNVYWAVAIAEWNEGRAERAKEYVERAIELLKSADDALQVARAHVFFGQILTLEDDFDAAADCLAVAEGPLLASGDETVVGLLRAEQAKVAAARGDEREALELAHQAERLLGDDVRYGGKRWHALASARAAGGDADGAASAYRRALHVLEERRQWLEAASVAREAARFLVETGREDDAWDMLERLAMLRTRAPAHAA
jgi:transcriptional regulator with XRE-family HTH domain